MKPYSIYTFCLLLVTLQLPAQKDLLQSGPMLGYSEMKEVLLWVQTKEAATVQFEYWKLEAPDTIFATAQMTTTEEKAFTEKLIADQVEPGNRYSYRLLINDQAISFNYPMEFQSQTLWQWRTAPPPFTVAIGSCTYINETVYDRPGRPYGSEYEIFTAIHEKRPDAMLWLGDNVYLREVDWYTRTGILHRYTHNRSVPELQPLLASTHHYATWDDHDFGPNDADRSFVHKDKTLEAFKLFWGNPTFGLPEHKGVTTFFKFNDIDFFVLDNRYYRSPNYLKKGDKTQLGKKQLEWIIDALVGSRAPFKMVMIGGQVLNPLPNDETYSHYHPEEREYLLKRIEEENIKGVIFLTGDRHFTSMSHYVNGAGNDIYDLTSSSLTAGSYTDPQEENPLMVEGTLVDVHNFGLLEFSGPRTERKLTIRVLDKDGKEQWSKSIDAPKR